jgi:hypothetical protein
VTAFVDAYAVLGVSPRATAAQLKVAHRQLVRRHHPDLAPPDRRAAATRRTQDLNLAYGLVRDPEARARYDRVRAAHLARAAVTTRVTAVDDRAAEQWEALVLAAGRWAGTWWRRHGAGVRRGALRGRMAATEALGRVLWLLFVVAGGLVGFVAVLAVGRLLGVDGPFSTGAAVFGGGWVGSRRGWARRLRLGGRAHLVPSARRAAHLALAVAVAATAAGLALDAVLFA